MLVIIVCISKHPFPNLHKDNIYLDGLWWVLCMMIFKVHSTMYCPSGMKEIFSSVQLSSVSQLCLTLCDPMDCSMPGFPVLNHLLEFVQTHVHWVGDAIQPSHPLSPSFLAFSLSQNEGLFQSVCTRRPKYWSFSFSKSASKEYSGLISFRIDWLDLLAVQGILKSLLQHHSMNAKFL